MKALSSVSLNLYGMVELLAVFGDDDVIAECARVSYQEGTKTVNDNVGLVDHLVRHHHTSPIEQVVARYRITCPIYLARQVFRHRTAAPNEESGRYSVLRERFDPPRKWRAPGGANKQGSVAVNDPERDARINTKVDAYLQAGYELYQDLLTNENVAREQARVILGLCLSTTFIWRQDLHNLLHLLRLRTDAHAQPEVQVYAEAMLELIRPYVPHTVASWENHVRFAQSFSLEELELLAAVLTPDVVADLKSRAQDHIPSRGRVREFGDKLERVLTLAG
jgi:thymidylate synthase (FAD)